jgi:hypothetical protein
MFEVNGFIFGDDELGPAVLELTSNLDTLDKLFDVFKNEWTTEYNNALQIMRKEGSETLYLSHITDCVNEKDYKKFFETVKNNC